MPPASHNPVLRTCMSAYTIVLMGALAGCAKPYEEPPINTGGNGDAGQGDSGQGDAGLRDTGTAVPDSGHTAMDGSLDGTFPDGGDAGDDNPFPGCHDLFPNNDSPATAHEYFGGPVTVSNTTAILYENVRFQGDKPEYFKVTASGSSGSNRPYIAFGVDNVPEEVRLEMTAACLNGEDRTVNCTIQDNTQVGDTQCNVSGNSGRVVVSTHHGCKGGSNDFTATVKVWFPNSTSCHNVSTLATVAK